jgi:hypothetical protein
MEDAGLWAWKLQRVMLNPAGCGASDGVRGSIPGAVKIMFAESVDSIIKRIIYWLIFQGLLRGVYYVLQGVYYVLISSWSGY